MADEQTQPQKKVTAKSLQEELKNNKIEAVLIIGFIVVLFYINHSTSPIKNFNDGNETRIINGIPNKPNETLYPPNSFVPQSSVSNTETFFEIFFFLVVCLVLLSKRAMILRRATMPEALQDIEKQINQLRNIRLSDGREIPLTDSDRVKISITPQFMTRYRFMAGNESKPEFRYTFLVTVHDNYEDENYLFRAWYHPWTRYWDGFFETKKSISEVDRCVRCNGTEFDTVYILGDDINKLKQLRKELGGSPR